MKVKPVELGGSFLLQMRSDGQQQHTGAGRVLLGPIEWMRCAGRPGSAGCGGDDDGERPTEVWSVDIGPSASHGAPGGRPTKPRPVD